MSQLLRLGPASAIVLLGFGLRAYPFRHHPLPNLVLGADGGWSLGLAVLGPQHFVRVLSRDIHPPGYYFLLHYWIQLVGTSPYAAKALNLMLAAVSLALAYHLGRRLAGAWGGIVAAAVLALLPIHIFGTGVIRDGTLHVFLLLASTVLLLRLDDRLARGGGGGWFWPAYGGFTLVGLLSSYLYVGGLAGQVGYVLWRRHRAWRCWVALAGGIALAYAPWAWVVAREWVRGRVGSEGRLEGVHWPRAADYGAALAQHLSTEFDAAVPPLVLGVALVLLLGAALVGSRLFPEAKPTRSGLRLVVLSLAGTLFAGYLASGLARGLAGPTTSRYVLFATPFLALVLGWAAAQAPRWRVGGGLLAPAPWLLLSGLAVVAALGFRGFYRQPPLPQSLWNPVGAVDYLDGQVGAGDGVLFVSLGQAGYYEALSRAPVPWDFFAVGDVYLGGDIERQLADVLPATLEGRRAVWVMLYGGENEAARRIKAWYDEHAFAAKHDWLSETLVYTYIPPSPPAVHSAGIVFGDFVRLEGWSAPEQVAPGSAVPLELTWRPLRPVDKDFAVFVHLLDGEGRRVSQFDAWPANGSAPTSGWRVGSLVRDRHGLLLPEELAPGSYEMVVGLYAGDERALLSDGSISLKLGTVEVRYD